MKKNGFKLPKLNFKKKTGNKGKKKKNWIDIVNIILCSVLVVGVLGGTAAILVFKNWIDTAPEMDMNQLENPESTQIFAADGTLIANLGELTQQNVPYEELPQAVIDAFVAVEDSRFFEHNGFDLPRFTKAILENLRTMNFDQGGSTLTMQLTRQAWLELDKSVPRKVREIYMAIRLEQQLSKRTILEYYINKINFGASTSRGIQAAAQYYFNKDVSELNLTESAYLAGVVNRPNGFNAYLNLEDGTARRNTVLDLMQRHGYISKEENILAKSINMEDILNDHNDSQDVTSVKYISYINTVVEEVIRVTGYDPYTTPMDIYTHMDITVQDKIEELLANDENFPKEDLMQAVIITMNNQTGEVVGVGGGRGDIVAKGHNRATSMYKQPGSTVKPFLSYALAFEYLGYATSHVLEDRPVYYRGTSKLLRNADRNYRGQVTVRDAMGRSLNVPAYLLLEEIADTISYQKIVEYLQNIGFSQVTTDNFDLGYAIGGSTFEITPMQMTGAYAVLMNGGYYIEPHTIDYIEYKDGSPPEYRIVSKTQVLSEQAAYLVADLISTNVSGSYNNYMQLLGNLGYPVYAKTGTTDWGTSGRQWGIPDGAGKDKWMVANTNTYTNTVWIGYDRAELNQETYFTSAKNRMNIPGQLNRQMLQVIATLEEERPSSILRPDGISEITHVLAVFPYAIPYEGMPAQWTATGLIKSSEANLVTFSGEDLEALQSFEVSASSSGGLSKTFNITLGAYPGGASSADSDQYDISLYSSSGNLVVAATGTMLFSPSWVLGAEYGARIIANGAVVADNRYNSNSFTMTADIANDASVQVCGYYSRSNGAQRSNEICRSVDFSTSTITVPNFSSRSDLNNFITTYGLSWTVNEQNASTISEINRVTSGGSTLNGTTRTLAQLKAISVVTYFKDRTVNLPASGSTSAQAQAAIQGYGGSYSSSLSGSDIVTSYTIGGVSYAPGAAVNLSALSSVTGVGTPAVVKTVTISQSGTTLTANTTGFSSPVYSWTKDGSPFGNTASVTSTGAGTYEVSVTEGGSGAAVSDSISIP